MVWLDAVSGVAQSFAPVFWFMSAQGYQIKLCVLNNTLKLQFLKTGDEHFHIHMKVNVKNKYKNQNCYHLFDV